MDTLANNLLSGYTDANGATDMLSTATSGGGIFGGFTIETIIIGGIASIMGIYFIKIGRKDGKIISLLCGVGLCGITYFVQNTGYLVGICLVLVIIPIFFKN